ncbi:MAG: hypothetical protein WCC84_08590, partial [Candidatus Cybelea sp.]
MRLNLLCASTLLAAMLAACSGGATSSSAIPSGSGGGGTTAMGHHKVKMEVIAVHPDRRPACPSTVIACFALNYGSGPYT